MTLQERVSMLRRTAAWVREEFAGQTTDEQRAELELEAENIEWAADELLRSANNGVASNG